MDTLTHIALGACIGELIATRRVGKKALLIGAATQNLPDVDVLAALWLDPSANLLAHRGITHSFLFAVLAAALLSWLLQAWWRPRETTFWFWFLFLGVELFTHTLIDGLNAYGTGWLEPFSDYRFSGHLLFVADPIFVVPLLVAVIYLIRTDRIMNRRRLVAALCLMWCSLCIAGAFYSKSKVVRAMARTIDRNNLAATDGFATPAPFSSLLWFCDIAIAGGHYVGYRSVFDESETLSLTYFPSGDLLLHGTADSSAIVRLKKFSKGFYVVAEQQDTVTFNDLRFGQIAGWENPRAPFAFHYYVRPTIGNAAVIQRGRLASSPLPALRSLVKRIFVEPPD
jgi:inner membrane protein